MSLMPSIRAYALQRTRYWLFEASFWLAMCVTPPKPPESLLEAYARRHARACCLLEYRLNHLKDAYQLTQEEIERILWRKQ